MKSKLVCNNHGKATIESISTDEFKEMEKTDKEKAMTALQDAIDKTRGL